MPLKKRTHIGDQEGLKLAYVTDEVTPEEAKWRLEEFQKCADDIDYFAEHYFYILDAKQNKVTIKLFPKQREFLHKIRDNSRVICAASRQVSKSTTYSIFCLYQIVMKKNYNILIAGNKGDTAREILTKIKDAYELVPNWIKPGIKVWNESKIVFDNGVMIKSTNTSSSMCRGLSISLLILDEVAFVDPSTQDAMWKSSEPTVSSVADSKIVLCSTPNGVGELFHRIWLDATSGQDTIWTAHRIDWWDVPWRDEQWHKNELKSLGSQEAFDQEYGVSFQQTGTGNKLITDSKILELKDLAEKSGITRLALPVDPKKPDFKFNYIQFYPYEENHTYVMGVDSAEGTGRDASIIYILDITSADSIKLVAKFDSAKVLPGEFAYCIYRLYLKYGNPKMMIESNAVGLAVIEALRNIANSAELNTNPKLASERFSMNDIVNYNRPAGHTGIMSNNQSKSLSMLNMQSIIQSNHYKLILADDELYRELPFCEKRTGSGNVTYKASKDHHDDHILALNWALFIMSKELIERYYTVEYAVDADTKQKYPVTVLPLGSDIQEFRKKRLNRNLAMDEAFELAMKWRRLGDYQRADYILQTIYDKEAEDNGGEWGRNPYGIDPSQFSEGFRNRFFKGYGDDGTAGGYFKPPVSDPHDMVEDSYGFGWEF